jgi:hypothetical protein
MYTFIKLGYLWEGLDENVVVSLDLIPKWLLHV